MIDAAAEIDELEATLERRFRTARTPATVAGEPVELLHPANADDLISEDDFVQDDRLPYWADIWPSSQALAERVARLGGSGRRAVEFGCGIGLVLTAAARAGYEALATDYYEDALLFARVNVWRNAGAAIGTRYVDWRALPDDLGKFDLVLASDVLYERQYGVLMAEAFARALAPGGAAILADPGRLARDDFLAEASRRGLAVYAAEPVPFAAGDVRQTITLFEIGWP